MAHQTRGRLTVIINRHPSHTVRLINSFISPPPVPATLTRRATITYFTICPRRTPRVYATPYTPHLVSSPSLAFCPPQHHRHLHSHAIS